MRASNAGRGGRGRRKAKRRQDQREENTEKKKKKAESKNFPSPKNHTQGNKPEAGKGGGCSPRPVLAAPGGGGGEGRRTDGRLDRRTRGSYLRAGGSRSHRPAGPLPAAAPGGAGGGGVGAVRPQPTAGPPSPLPAGGQPPFPARPGARTSPGDRQLPRPGAGLSAPLPLFLPFRGVFLALPACGRRRLHFGAERGATGGGRGEGCCTAAPGGLDPRVSVHREGAWALDGAGGGAAPGAPREGRKVPRGLRVPPSPAQFAQVHFFSGPSTQDRGGGG